MKENSIEDRINNAYCFLNSMHSDFRTGLYYKEDLENLEHILSDYKRVLKENEELKEYKKIAELTKISCCTAQNCEALNNAIKSELENQKLKEELNDINQKWIQKVKDKIEEINKNLYTVEYYETVGAINVLQELLEGRK